MNAFGNNLLSAIDRLSGQLGPITVLIDGIVDCIAPKVRAQACCPPAGYHYCSHTCGACCANCSGDYKSWDYSLWTQYSGCAGHGVTCTNCDFC